MLSNAFDFGDKKLRVYGTSEEPWFCGKDVCEILEYKKSTNVISALPFEFLDLNFLVKNIAANFGSQANKSLMNSVTANLSCKESKSEISSFNSSKNFEPFKEINVLYSSKPVSH